MIIVPIHATVDNPKVDRPSIGNATSSIGSIKILKVSINV